jgi:tyrosine-protein kinase Etk/Wzc
MGINDPLLNNLVEQLSVLYGKKRSYEMHSTSKDPGLEQVNSQIQSTMITLKENIQNIIRPAEIELENIENRIYQVEREIQKLPVTEKKLLNIQRQFELNDNIYTYLLEKRAEAGIVMASNIADNKVIDYAMPENAAMISPKKNLNFIIAFIIGILVPLLIIILRDFFNDKIIERKDVEDNTSIPILGAVGHNNKESELVVHDKPKSSIAESFRTLRTNLQYMMKG